MVQLLKDSWAKAEPYPDELSQFFHGMLFTLAPEVRDFFPVNMGPQHGKFVRAVARLVHMMDRPGDLIPFLEQLGKDYRKFGLTSEHYEAVGTALLAALKNQLEADWTSEVERAWAEAFTLVARTMQEAAAADTSPACLSVTVTEHRRLSWDLALVRVEPEATVPFQPGQYLSVEIPQRPRLWRYLSPANAPRPDGSLEFHVRAVDGGWVSRSIVSHTQSGDVWRVGPPLGRLSVDRKSGRNALMVAGGTGLAPLRSMLDGLAQWGQNPTVQLFVGATTSDELYDLDELRQLSSVNPWLNVVPVVEHGAAGPECEYGTLADAVTRRGAWPNYDVFVAGSPAMIRGTVSRMLVAGTTLEQIHYDPFTLD